MADRSFELNKNGKRYTMLPLLGILPEVPQKKIL
jgi:hypothetical protein